ncbi:MAG TPA: hypothetical protein VNE67_12375 [Acetobacteraceae bacterium]|nr:hypothetical protein [Acetobacteraceae bacterium]
MSSEIHADCGLRAIVRDPLVRLVMASDGVAEADLVALMHRVRRALRSDGAGTTREIGFGAAPLPPVASGPGRVLGSSCWR